jgi:hypothetical protein
LVLPVEIGAAVEAPGSVRCGPSLAHAIDMGFAAVRVEACGDAKEGFDVVHCVFQHVSLDAGNFVGDAVGSADDGAEGKYDAVKAGGGIIAELEVGERSKEAIFRLEHLQSDWIEGGPAWPGSVVAFI